MTVDMSVVAETLSLKYIVKKQLEAMYGEWSHALTLCSEERVWHCWSVVCYALYKIDRQEQRQLQASIFHA